LVRTTDYTEASDGKSVTLVNAAQAGDEVVAVTFAQDPASGGGSSYTDADVDAHLLTAGVSLDATNDRVGMGTASPSQRLHVEGTGNQFILLNNSSTNDGMYLKAGTGASSIQTNGGSHVLNFFTSGTEHMKIDSSGHVTKPNQPCFHARRTGGNGTTGTIVFNTADLNIGNNYNTSTGNFTAPIAGRYVFYTTLLSNNATTLGIDLKINGTRYAVTEESWTVNAYRSSSLTVVASLAANDAVRVENKVGGYYGSNHYTFFGGYLLS
jgi:hypothetical protein